MYLDSITGQLVGIFIEWGVLMAFLFNLSTSINKVDKSPLILSAIMALSYFVTDVIKLSDAPYLNWFLYDLITILVLSFWLLVKSVKLFTASIYVIAGLLLNASFMLSMHYDIFILGNREPWLLWSVFSIGVNLLDLMMIIAIASNKDFLLLKKFVKYPMSSSEKPEEKLELI